MIKKTEDTDKQTKVKNAVDSEKVKLDSTETEKDSKNNNYSISDKLSINTGDAKNALGTIGLLVFSIGSLVVLSLKKK